MRVLEIKLTEVDYRLSNKQIINLLNQKLNEIQKET